MYVLILIRFRNVLESVSVRNDGNRRKSKILSYFFLNNKPLINFGNRFKFMRNKNQCLFHKKDLNISKWSLIKTNNNFLCLKYSSYIFIWITTGNIKFAISLKFALLLSSIEKKYNSYNCFKSYFSSDQILFFFFSIFCSVTPTFWFPSSLNFQKETYQQRLYNLKINSDVTLLKRLRIFWVKYHELSIQRFTH